MKYLLDVNALIALKHSRSVHHLLCRSWCAKVGMDQLATCALTELGFLRVSMAAFHLTLKEAQGDLSDLKKKISFFVESCPPPLLSQGASSASSTTDVYLVQLADSAGLALATFDTKIRGAMVIR